MGQGREQFHLDWRHTITQADNGHCGSHFIVHAGRCHHDKLRFCLECPLSMLSLWKKVCTTATEYRRIFHLSKYTPFAISLPCLAPLYKAWSYGRYVSLKYKGPVRVKGYFKVSISFVYCYEEIVLVFLHCKKIYECNILQRLVIEIPALNDV